MKKTRFYIQSYRKLIELGELKEIDTVYFHGSYISAETVFETVLYRPAAFPAEVVYCTQFATDDETEARGAFEALRERFRHAPAADLVVRDGKVYADCAVLTLERECEDSGTSCWSTAVVDYEAKAIESMQRMP